MADHGASRTWIRSVVTSATKEGGGIAATLIRLFLVVWAGLAFLTGCDMVLYLLDVRPVYALSGAPPTQKVALLLAIVGTLAVLLGLGAWRMRQPSSAQRQITSSWSPAVVLFWTIIVVYVHLVYYPLPPHSHHVDKLILFAVLSLIWSLVFVFRGDALDWFLHSRLYGWLTIGLINVLVFVLVAEVVLRSADPWLARTGLFGDKHTPAKLTPHVKVRGSIGQTNSQGFRDRERSLDRPTSAPRVIALGDSFTFGAGVTYDQTFTALLEEELQEIGPGAEVINLGVPGWEVHEELHLLKAYGIKFTPDIVMLNLFVGNDILRRRGFDLEEGMIVAGQSYYVHLSGGWLHDRLSPDKWFLYHVLNYLKTMTTIRMGGLDEERGAVTKGFDNWKPLVPRKVYLEEIEQRSEVYLKEDTAFFVQRWQRAQSSLEEMSLFAKSRGAILMVVALPAHEQIDPALQGELLSSFGADPAQYDWAKPQRLLREWCADHGVRFVDLLPIFNAHPDPEGLYLRNDMHWSVAGHETAASGMLPELRDTVLESEEGHSSAG